MKNIEEVLKKTTEENQENTDWSKAWSTKYPVLATYHNSADVEKIKEQLSAMIDELKAANGYSEQDSMLVIKDILYNLYKERKDRKK